MARTRRLGSIAVRGRCCGTSPPGIRRRHGRTGAGDAPPNGSTSIGITTVGCKTCWSPRPWTDTDVHPYKIRDGQQSLADKLAAIEATGVLGVDLSWLNANYQRALFHFVRKSSADRLREVARPRRLAALVCFLRQSYRDAVDQAVDMFDKFLTRTHTRAEHELSDQMRSQRQTIKAALAALRSLGAIILDDAVGNAALRSRLFAAVPRDALKAQVAGLDEWVTGKKSDVFHGLVRR